MLEGLSDKVQVTYRYPKPAMVMTLLGASHENQGRALRAMLLPW